MNNENYEKLSVKTKLELKIDLLEEGMNIKSMLMMK